MCAGLVNLMWTVLAFQPGRGPAGRGWARRGKARRGWAGKAELGMA